MGEADAPLGHPGGVEGGGDGAVTEATVGFEENFGGGLDLEGEYFAGGSGEPAGGVEAGGEEGSGEAFKPVEWGENVIVGGDEDDAAGGSDAAVAGLREAGDGFLRPDDLREARDERGCQAGGWVVIDDEDFKGVGGLLEEEGLQAVGQSGGAVVGG